MHIAITGSRGLIGSALVPALERAGHTVTRLNRGPYEAEKLEGFDAIVHLGAETVAGRWTDARKHQIRESRVVGTRSLAQAVAGMKRPLSVLIAASAIGYYGDRGAETMQEEHGRGMGFLAEVCEAWENATLPARRAHVRVVNLRLGVVLSPSGGALARMLTPFRLGLGGKIGDGCQYMSWIAIDDVVAIIQRALLPRLLDGPVNVVAPHPVTNAEFTATLARVLSRPSLLPMPATLARLLFGEMANELLLASTRVEPIRLISTGYRFQHPELEEALRHMLEVAHVAVKEVHA